MRRLNVRLCLLHALLLGCEFASAFRTSAEVTNTAFARHLEELAKQVPAGFTVIVQRPFVVLGDEPPDVVHRRATQTVKWAVEKLKQDFFQRDPQEIINIWLFKDAASYTNNAKLLFDDTPSSRFGYYSAGNHALIMN